MRDKLVPTFILSLALAVGVLGCQERSLRVDYVEGELLNKSRAALSEARMAQIYQCLGNRLAECCHEIQQN